MSDFPNRPDHPDFWKLSEIVTRLDRQVDTSPSESERQSRFEREVGRHIDMDTLYYMASQRAMRVLGITTADELIRQRDEIVPQIQMFVDAFIMACNFKDVTMVPPDSTRRIGALAEDALAFLDEKLGDDPEWRASRGGDA